MRIPRLSLVGRLGLAVVLGVAVGHCAETGFQGASGKNAADEDDEDEDDEASDDDDATTSTETGTGTDGDIGTSNDGAQASVVDFGNENAVDLFENQLDEVGILTDDCRVQVDLPDSAEQLVEVFTWHASGDKAAYNQVMAAPVVGPINAADAVPTIFATAFQSCNYTSGGAYLFAIDGKTAAQKWVSPILIVPSSSAALGDVDGVAGNEVIVLGLDGKTYALNGQGAIKWTSADATHVGTSNHGGPALGDLDQDGSPEVVTQLKVLNGANGTTKFSINGANGTTSIIGDVNNAPGLEVVTSAGIYSATGTLICSFPVGIINQAVARLRATDVAMTVVGNVNGAAVGYNGATCAQVFQTAFPGGGGGPYNLADYDGDGELEAGSAGKANFATFETGGPEKWKMATKDPSSSVTGATTFDFNADRKNEIVYNDEDFLRVYDGSSGKVLYQTPNSSGTLFEYPVVVDADGDGHANIVVHANNCFSYTNQVSYGVRVFRSPNNDWVGTRAIWNQHGYNPLLVKNDGGLTGISKDKIWKPWLKSEHLVGFRNNVPKPEIKTECK